MAKHAPSVRPPHFEENIGVNSVIAGKPLPLLKSLGISKVGEFWCVYELETRGDVVVSRKIITEGQNKAGALARLKDETDFANWRPEVK